jgi:ribosomal protein S4
MNKLNPRNKICLQNNENIHTNLNISKLNKKKWNLLKKNLLKNKTIENKPEEKKKFFKERLFSKQQLKFFYGCISEHQLKNIFNLIKKKRNKINILQDLIVSLESRLDVVVFRFKIVNSIFHSKQLINHGKIKVNNKIIFSQNYLLKKGDIISLNNFKIDIKKLNKVNYLEYNNLLKIGIFLRKPFFNEIEYPFSLNLKLIDEYLKKK